MAKTADRATRLLRETLADGPKAVSRLKEAAIHAGIGWRSVETAKTALGVEAHKVGTAWQWSLAQPAATQGRKATPQAERHESGASPVDLRAELRRLAEMLATVQALAERLHERIEGTDRSLPAPVVEAPSRALIDRRVFPGGARGTGRWGPGRLVRCCDCTRGEDIRTDGQCPTSGLVITWPYARRACAAFIDYRDGEAL